MDSSSQPDWSLWQSFAAVASAGSLSGAAQKLHQSQPTLGRHIRQLEQQLDLRLFNRVPRGLELTDQGMALLEPAQQMVAAAARLDLAATGQSERPSGTVRITASVIMSHYVIPPIIAQIRQALPKIEIELLASDATENLLFHEADIAVRMYRPTQLDIVTQRVGAMGIGLFAADTYLDQHGAPDTFQDALDHQWIGYDKSDLIIQGMRAFGNIVERNFFGTRCDNQTVYWELLRAGCGIGVGQHFVAAQYPTVKSVLPMVQIPPIEVWLSLPEALRHTPRVRKVYDLLSEHLQHATDA
ncbi:MAG: LysR family transcriptional regulator [Pseudoruegeria sp.]